MNFKQSQSTHRILADRAVQVVDFCLLGCLLLAPLWFGGRHDLGRLLYSGFVATGVIAWAMRCYLLRQPAIRWSAAHWLLMAAIGLVVCQLLPLSPATLARVSPGLASLAPAWTSGGDFQLQLGVWNTISVTPAATQVGLAVLVTHALLFCLVVERLETAADVRRLLQLVAIAAASMAAFGLLQWLTSNGKLLWFYQHPQRAIGEDVQGSFANKNHFAHFVVLGVGPLIAAALAARGQILSGQASRRTRPADIKRWKTILLVWSIALLTAVVAVLLSLSRGGWVALLVATLVGCLVLMKRGEFRSRRTLFAAAGLAAAALFVISFGDMDRLAGRVQAIEEGSIAKFDLHGARRAIWAANIEAVRQNPWLGYGVGSHADVYPAFIESGFFTNFTHAESGYLHTLTETGLAGGLLLLAAIGLVGYWCVRGVLGERDPQRIIAWAAVSAGLAASLVHSLVDFVWYLPACMCLTLVLAACALRLHQTAHDAPAQPATDPRQNKSHRTAARPPAWAWAPVAASLMLATWATSALWAPGRASLAWDHYQRNSVVERELALSLLYNPSDNPRSDAATMRFLKQQMIASLKKAIELYPGHTRARLRLAGRMLQQFELEKSDSPNAMALVHIRQSALGSNFPSRAATVDWLRRAFGDATIRLVAAYDQARIALAQAPFQSDGYTYLATTNFLAPPHQRDIPTIMRQALILRPQDGGTLFEAGRQAIVTGRVEQAIELWLRAHQLPGPHRGELVWLLTQNFPARDYLLDFEPDWQTFVLASRHYRLRGNPADLQAIGVYAEQLAHTLRETEQPRNCARAWKLASDIAGERGESREQARCMNHAVKALPSDYAMRHELARVLVECQAYSEAMLHLRWCLVRRPGNKGLTKWLHQAQTQPRSASDATASAGDGEQVLKK